jgi:HK97 family phage major capsid protein
MEIINFSAELTSSDTERRIIGGQIVPFEKIGSTNVGKVVFEKGSISIDPSKRQKLLLEHDPKAPLGYLKKDSVQITDTGIYAEFKLSNTQRGNDALIEASDEWQLRNGLSVGVEVIKGKNKDGVYHVTAATLHEVSLVQAAAFGNENAGVSKVAASQNAEAVSTETKTEIEEIVDNTTTDTPVATEVVETPAVEASRPTVTAAVYTTPRVAPMTSSQYLENSIKAAMGDDSARQLILAADSSTSTNTGLTLPLHMQEFVTTTISDRPAVDSVSRGVLPASGLSFTVPKLSVAPAVAEVNEGAAMTNAEMESNYLTASVVKLAAKNEVTWELLDRSSPIFYDELISELNKAYAKKSDQLVLQTIVADGTAATATAATAAGFQSFIATEAAAAKKATGSFARNLVASTDVWAAIMGYADSTGRALYTASNPSNASGNVSVSSLTGQILGTNLYVDPYVAASGFIDDSCFLIVPEAITYYESPVTKLQVQLSDNGKISVQIYGYASVLTKVAGGIRKFNLT